MDKLFSVIQQSLTQTNTDDNKNKLLQDQQISQQTINKLLEQASQTTLCGPTCQKLKVSQELKQKYLDAETNMQIAPIKLEQSRRNYYVFTQGRSEYENMNEKELVTKAETISQMLKENFNNEVTNANTMNTLLNTALINSKNTVKLFKDYSKKNKELMLELKETRGDILTNDRRTYYKTEALDNLKWWHKFFLIVYYILVTLCLALIFTNHNLTKIKRIIISVLIIFYPLYINYLVEIIYELWELIKKRIPKNVYNDL